MGTTGLKNNKNQKKGKSVVKKVAKSSQSNKEVKKFETPYGYFTEDGMEYVIKRPDTPRPWVNVLCNGGYGLVESQTGGGFSWLDNSNLSRITRWEQDLIKDDWGRFIYVRDNDSKKFWSLTWKPMRTEFDEFQVRYGLGYSVYKSLYQGIRMERTVTVDRKEPMEIWKIKLTNETSKARSLSLFTYFEWCLGNSGDTHREFHKTFIETQVDVSRNVLYGSKRAALVPKSVSAGAESPIEAFIASNVKLSGYEGDKEAFFGRYGDALSPRAVVEGKTLKSGGKWEDSIASLKVDVKLKAGETKEILFMLGATTERAHSERIIEKYKKVEAFDQELEGVKAFWADWVQKCFVETPDDSLNFMTNIWLKHQAISGRLWAKCAYYQSSGGIGFRDQLQDSHIFLPLDTKLTRKQINLHAEQQFPDGTVYHWWHPNTTIAAITEMTDDLLWLSYLVLSYIDETDDVSILNDVAPFVKWKGRDEKGTIYEHCNRAFGMVFSRFSKRGLPLIGEGDWNDGLSHVGLDWKGESIWLAHFLYGLLDRFAPLCDEMNDKKRGATYRKKAVALKEAINKYAWDGKWYFRATRDDGRLLGSHKSRDGKIFLNAQTWSVLSGSATPERGRQAMASAEKYLFREYGPLLLTPAFSVTDSRVGYITRYAPAVRENGGVYTHAATWGIMAQAQLGNKESAYSAYQSICPIERGQDPELYYGEPYVTPGNVDGPDSPHFGRGGWTWYTGSGAWLFRVTWEGILGVRATRKGLLIQPACPEKWPSYRLRREFRGASYDIKVSNPKKKYSGVKEITVDGKVIRGKVVPAFGDGKVHQVEVLLG